MHRAPRSPTRSVRAWRDLLAAGRFVQAARVAAARTCDSDTADGTATAHVTLPARDNLEPHGTVLLLAPIPAATTDERVAMQYACVNLPRQMMEAK